MTDARLRGEWLHALKFNELSGDAWRVFTSALMWSNENGTDGRVPLRYVKLLHPDGERPDAVAELEEAGIWSRTEVGYQLDDWDGAMGQSTAVQVETYRAQARKRSRDFRERERMKIANFVGFDSSVTRDVTRDATRDVREHVGKGKGTGALDPGNLKKSGSGEVVGSPRESWSGTVPGTDEPVCRVEGCTNLLRAGTSNLRTGVCPRADEAHQLARRAA